MNLGAKPRHKSASSNLGANIGPSGSFGRGGKSITGGMTSSSLESGGGWSCLSSQVGSPVSVLVEVLIDSPLLVICQNLIEFLYYSTISCWYDFCLSSL